MPCACPAHGMQSAASRKRPSMIDADTVACSHECSSHRVDHLLDHKLIAVMAALISESP